MEKTRIQMQIVQSSRGRSVNTQKVVIMIIGHRLNQDQQGWSGGLSLTSKARKGLLMVYLMPETYGSYVSKIMVGKKKSFLYVSSLYSLP